MHKNRGSTLNIIDYETMREPSAPRIAARAMTFSRNFQAGKDAVA